MKTSIVVLCSVMAIAPVIGGEFINLDFEQVDTSKIDFFPNPPPFIGGGKTSDLLPGWSITYNGVSYNFMGFNLAPIGSQGPPVFSIFSRNGLRGDTFAFSTGKYVLRGQSLQPTPAILSQVGDIPPEATQIRLTTLKDNSTYLRTFLNGTEIFNGDISPFAGQENVRLDIEMGLVHEQTSLDVIGPNIWLDRVEFVPEPSTYALLAIGGLGFLGQQLARRRSIRLRRE